MLIEVITVFSVIPLPTGTPLLESAKLVHNLRYIINLKEDASALLIFHFKLHRITALVVVILISGARCIKVVSTAPKIWCFEKIIYIAYVPITPLMLTLQVNASPAVHNGILQQRNANNAKKINYGTQLRQPASAYLPSLFWRAIIHAYPVKLVKTGTEIKNNV